ncbi:hypothetical protein K1719_035641 [Acacia pycnantha]|nr:hypothetical protein K1719_035641 [Acacia pycnantha]
MNIVFVQSFAPFTLSLWSHSFAANRHSFRRFTVRATLGLASENYLRICSSRQTSIYSWDPHMNVEFF